MYKAKMHPTARRLIMMRGLRSIGQGAMVVDLTLYLRTLHWNGASIGAVTSAAGLFGVVLILGVGVLSDRLGRRPFLLVYEALTILAALAAAITTNALVLALAIMVAGFGRGQSGAAGPFSPAEQAWLARVVARAERGAVFSLSNAVGFVGMAIGAFIGGLPDVLHTGSPLADYRPVFLLVAVFSLFCLALIAATPEESEPLQTEAQGAEHTQGPEDETSIRRKENRFMLALAAVNSLNGLAVGLTGPLMAYWLSIRYGASTGAIGITLAIGFLATGFFSIVSGALADRFGMVKSVTFLRVVGSVLMLALPWMPNFLLASGLFVLRSALNRGTQGNGTALSASLTRDHRRGLATSINALSMRLPSAIGPTISGYLFDMNELALPLILTAVLQLANAGLYQWVFGSYDRPEQA